jgi:hypothetical protein
MDVKQTAILDKLVADGLITSWQPETDWIPADDEETLTRLDETLEWATSEES